jgi:dolichol kinase
MKIKNNQLDDLLNQVKSIPSETIGQFQIIEHDYRVEVIRKLIHLVSLSIPIGYYFLSKSTALTILIPLTVAFLAVDITRYYNKQIEEWFYKYFGFLLRKRESNKARKTLNGATYVLISSIICIIVFPKIITVTSFSILIISDITSALIGRRFGKHRFIAKSLEGSAAFFISALIVVALTPKINYQIGEYLIGAASAIIGTLTEALPADFDDNLTIPITVGVTLWILYAIFLPGLNLYILD